MDLYPKIGQFYNIPKYVRRFHAGLPPVVYQGTVKLHGTNAGVRLHEGYVIPQSRNRALTVDADNYGFAEWALLPTAQVYFARIADTVNARCGAEPGADITLYGEWCGRGIQKGVAIEGLDRMFVLLTARLGDGGKNLVDILPSDLPEGAGDLSLFCVQRAPVYALTVDWMDDASVEAARVECERRTLEVDQECPFAATFGVKGHGEGIVWKPVEHMGWDELWFKTKGEAHKAAGAEGARVKGVPLKAEGVPAFVASACSEDRFLQGLDFLRENAFELDIRATAKFIGWVCKDVATECADDLEASGLSWKQVQGSVANAASVWFRKHISAL